MAYSENAIPCPECQFPNSPGAVRCLTCNATIPQLEQAATQAHDRKKIDPPTSKWSVPAEALTSAPEAVAWLSCDPLPPIPIGTPERLVVGRGKDCDLTLPNHGVSRRHAALKLEGQEIVFEDLGSRNGCFLNGKRITSAKLRVGDILTVGPYDLEVRAARETAPVPGDEMEGTQPLARITAGMLSEVPLVQTLQEIEFNQKSGSLKVISGDLRGNLVVFSGQPVSATLGDLRDDEAVVAMLELKEGRWVFSTAMGNTSKTMDTTLTRLLLSYTHKRDETNRSARP